MRKRDLLYPLLGAALLVGLWACTKNDLGGDPPPEVKNALTVDQARAVFEQQVIATRSKAHAAYDPQNLSPGDFVPQWNRIQITSTADACGADIPIVPTYRYMAKYFSQDADGCTTYQAVDVMQKLVVKKLRRSDDPQQHITAPFIASIVPSVEYNELHKGVWWSYIYGARDKQGFSGFVLYHTLGGALVGLERFEDGKSRSSHYFASINEHNVDSVRQIYDSEVGNTTFVGISPRLPDIDVEGVHIILCTVCDQRIDQGRCTCGGRYTCNKCGQDLRFCKCWVGTERPNGLPNGGLSVLDRPGLPPFDPNGGSGSGNGGGIYGTGPVTVETPIFQIDRLNDQQVAVLNKAIKKLKESFAKKIMTTLEASKIKLKVRIDKTMDPNLALYGHMEKTLTFGDVPVPADAAFEALVAHELFHAFQGIKANSWFTEKNNRNAVEFEAYMLQNLVLVMDQDREMILQFPGEKSDERKAKAKRCAEDIGRLTDNYSHPPTSSQVDELYKDYGSLFECDPNAGTPEFNSIGDILQ